MHTELFFFAPAHSFDQITVDVCRDSKLFDFISDGYALDVFNENGMVFVPSIFDTAYSVLPFGTYTFIIHPSFVTDEKLSHLEKFIIKNKKSFVPVQEILSNSDIYRPRNIFEKCIYPAIALFRKIRKQIRG